MYKINYKDIIYNIHVIMGQCQVGYFDRFRSEN